MNGLIKDNTAWLASLAVGDEAVAVRSRTSGETNRVVVKITGITKTLFKLSNNYSVRRSDGYERGDGYHKLSIVKATPDLCMQIVADKRRRSLLSRFLLPAFWKARTNEQLESVAAALELSCPPEHR